MPLSEYEQRVLEQMERHLSTDDPRLANRLTQRGRPLTRYLVAGAGTVVGLAALVLGVDLGQWWLGSLGFVVMFAAVAFAFSRPRQKVVADGRKATADGAASRPARRPARRGLMDVFEERWNRRRDQR